MEQYMDDYDSYKRFTAFKCKCRCLAHCGHSCQDCENCPDYECKECLEGQDK
jgi:hypothetical protein